MRGRSPYLGHSAARHPQDGKRDAVNPVKNAVFDGVTPARYAVQAWETLSELHKLFECYHKHHEIMGCTKSMAKLPAFPVSP